MARSSRPQSRRETAASGKKWSPFPPPRWEIFTPPLTPPKVNEFGDYSGLHLPINRRRNNRLSGMRLYLLFVEFEPGFAYHKRSVRRWFDESLFNQFFCGARFDRIALRFPTV